MEIKTKTTIKLWVILILTLISLVTALDLAYTHFVPPTEGAFCDLSEAITCSLVNTSVFSKFLEVPVSIFGAIWALILGLVTISLLRKQDKQLNTFIYVWSMIGMVFVAYLIIAEIILKALCPLCTIVHISTFITLLIVSTLPREKMRGKEKKFVGLALILFAIPLVIFTIEVGPSGDFTEFAKCITDSEINMYSSFRCGFCARTRQNFDDAFEHINEIECHPDGKDSQFELCFEKEIKNTPTWVLEPNGVEEKRNTGYLSMRELSEFSGCPLPEENK